MRGEMAHSIVLALAKTLHTGKKIVLAYEGIQSHGGGMVVGWTYPWVVERIDVITPISPSADDEG